MKKAKFVRAYVPKYGKYKELIYLYRGEEYIITDYGMSGMTLAEQHKMAQNRIDRDIDIEEKAKNHKPTTTAQEDFAFFWEYVNS